MRDAVHWASAPSRVHKKGDFPVAKNSSPKWIVVIEFVAAVEAEVIMSMLLGAGIRARLIQESVARLYGFDSGPIGGIRIEVVEEDLEAASELLDVGDVENGLGEDVEGEDAKSDGPEAAD